MSKRLQLPAQGLSDQNTPKNNIKTNTMCTGGYIKLFRKFNDWEWYTDGSTMRVFIHLLINANYVNKRWRGIEVKAGQMVTSREHLAHDLRLSDAQVRLALKKLISTNEITIETTNKYSLVTICNFESYQNNEEYEQPAEQPTTEPSNDQQITNKQPTNDHNIIKKEIKKERNNIINSYVPQENCDAKQPESKSRVVMVKPTLDEVKAYVAEKQFSDVDPERFWCYYESQGWKVGKNPMKNWKMAVNTWHNKTTNYGSNNNINNDKRRGTYANATSAQEYSTSF